MSTQLLAGIAKILAKVTTAEAARMQLNKIRSKADRQWVLEQLDFAQRRRIENGFKPGVDDWVEVPKGAGVITRVEDNQAEVYLHKSNYFIEINGEEFKVVSDWFPLSDLRIANCPPEYDQDYESFIAYKQLPEEDKIIEDFLILFKVARSDDDLEALSDCIRKAYLNKEISKDTACAIYEAIPEDLQQKIEEIKKRRKVLTDHQYAATSFQR